MCACVQISVSEWLEKTMFLTAVGLVTFTNSFRPYLTKDSDRQKNKGRNRLGARDTNKLNEAENTRVEDGHRWPGVPISRSDKYVLPCTLGR